MLRRVSEVLGVPKEDLKKAILDDHGKTLENYLNIRKVSTEQVRSSVQAEKHEEVKEINTSTPSFLGQPELKKGAY